MASRDEYFCLHVPLSAIMFSGAVLNLVSVSMYFLTFEYRDRNTKISQSGSRVLSRQQRKRLQQFIWIAFSIFVASIVLFVVAMSLYKSQKTELPSNVTDLYQHVQRTENQPSFNYPALIASLSGALVITGVYLLHREFVQSRNLDWKGMIPFALGFYGLAYTASVHRNGLSSTQPIRLAWSFPSITLYLIGIMMIPFQLQKNFIYLPSQVLVTLGLIGFTLSNSLVHHFDYD